MDDGATGAPVAFVEAQLVKTSILTLALTLAAAPLAGAQTVPAPAVAALPPATITTEPASSELSPLEAEACRRLTAEAQIAKDVAAAPPVSTEPEAKPMTRTQGVGAVTGSVVGQVAGAAVAGPVGAALGALVAGKVGQSMAGRAEKALSSEDEKKAKEAALAAAQPVTVPGPVPELLNECESRGATTVAGTVTADTVTPVAAPAP